MRRGFAPARSGPRGPLRRDETGGIRATKRPSCASRMATMDRAVPDPEVLLTNTAWMTRLARRLVADDQLAEDLVQDTWLQAIRSPPRDPATLGAWLRRVLTRLAGRVARRESERPARELRAAAGPGGAPQRRNEANGRAAGRER